MSVAINELEATNSYTSHMIASAILLYLRCATWTALGNILNLLQRLSFFPRPLLAVGSSIRSFRCCIFCGLQSHLLLDASLAFVPGHLTYDAMSVVACLTSEDGLICAVWMELTGVAGGRHAVAEIVVEIQNSAEGIFFVPRARHGQNWRGCTVYLESTNFSNCDCEAIALMIS